METTLTLDFDAARSVHFAPGQGWIMRPVIEVIGETVEPQDDEPEGDGESTDSGEDPDETGGITPQ